VLTNW